MRFTKTAVAVEIAVLLSILVVIEWLAHVLTNTRDMFVPAVLALGVYLVVASETNGSSGWIRASFR